jgi:hypothetical protein
LIIFALNFNFCCGILLSSPPKIVYHSKVKHYYFKKFVSTDL